MTTEAIEEEKLGMELAANNHHIPVPIPQY
nr:hypothetical protein [Tanacetum cinerariifolium]